MKGMDRLRRLFDGKRLIGGGRLPDEPVARIILTPLVEEKLNSYTARGDPFFAEVIQLCDEGNFVDAVGRWRMLTGHSLEEARLWFEAQDLSATNNKKNV